MLHEEEDIEEESLWKKIFVILGSVFLILLVMSYMFTSYGVREIIAGMLDSEEVEDNIVDTGEFKVIFEGETYNDVLEIYEENLAVETKMCLLGNYDGDYHVTEVIKPVIYSQEFNQVVSASCDKDAIIALHSHPYKRCLASEQDISNLKQSQEVNPNVIVGIICEEDRFSFYS
ncbi:MAG: hypothetical protein ABIJ18_05030 [archaeon]